MLSFSCRTSSNVKTSRLKTQQTVVEWSLNVRPRTMTRDFDFPLRQQLTTPLAARYLGLRPDTLMGWRKSGHGPRFLRYGRTIRYDQGDLDLWRAMHVQEPRFCRDVTPSEQTTDVIHIHNKRPMARK
jgi:hypothetical protein